MVWLPFTSNIDKSYLSPLSRASAVALLRELEPVPDELLEEPGVMKIFSHFFSPLSN